MNNNYSITTKYDFNSIGIEDYKILLEDTYGNNPYYALDHIKYFSNTNEELKYFVFNKNEKPIILMPIIIRGINNTNGQTFFDAISPYGYSGPLTNSTVSEQEMIIFWEEVDKWYKANNVISEFVRFNLRGNHIGYSGKQIKSLLNIKGKLFDNFEDQWNAFLPKVRNNYRKASKYNLTIEFFEKEQITAKVINVFFEIYTMTMKRNNAKSMYFFSEEYFKNLILNNLDYFIIAVVAYENKPISVELIIKNKADIYAYLGGTNAAYFNYRPNDFLRVEIIKWAISRNKEHYILGGGIKDGDGLYKSKKAFFPKNDDVIYYTGKKILDVRKYRELCLHLDDEFLSKEDEILNECFFPYYRNNQCNI